MKPGDAVLVPAVVLGRLADDPLERVVVEMRVSPSADAVTTEAAIRADERAKVEAEHERTTNDDLQDDHNERVIRADERRRVAEMLWERIEAEAARYSGGRVNAIVAEAMRMVDDVTSALDGFSTEAATRADERRRVLAEDLKAGTMKHVALWDAINAYSQACGGHPTRGGVARMNAVVQVERSLAAMFAADALEREGGAEPKPQTCNRGGPGCRIKHEGCTPCWDGVVREGGEVKVVSTADVEAVLGSLVWHRADRPTVARAIESIRLRAVDVDARALLGDCGARCYYCGHYEIDYDRAVAQYARCPSCDRHSCWRVVDKGGAG